MNQMPPPEQLPRNLATKIQHRREVFWQITIPLLVAILILLGMSVVVVTSSATQVSLWADISLIGLIIPALFFSLLFTLILAAFAILVIQIIRWLPYYAFRALSWLRLVDRRVKSLNDSVAEPFLRYHSFTASLGALTRQVRRR
jgi:hypothetical protein